MIFVSSSSSSCRRPTMIGSFSFTKTTKNKVYSTISSKNKFSIFQSFNNKSIFEKNNKFRSHSTASTPRSIALSEPVPRRVRFAPSPTGFMHLGALRTALYNYLFARQHPHGVFVLRIEDTDRTRLVPGSVDQILRTLHWAGIPPDEGPTSGSQNKLDLGPYVQSERIELYKQYAQQLVESGHAYHCFCSAERLQRLREEGERRGIGSMYDRHCLVSLSPSEVKARLAAGEPSIIRMKVPGRETSSSSDNNNNNNLTVLNDMIKGTVMIANDVVDDQVLLKSDGYPTYHLANVVDDHLMQITHVIRGEEWISSTPKHIILYNMFGWQPPKFAHLPLLLNEDRSKLSKRQGHASVDWYRDQGYLPESLVNFVAFLGWTPDTISQTSTSSPQHSSEKDGKEIFSLEELVDQFSLEKVHKGGAIVNLKKLEWINGQHIRRQIDKAFSSSSPVSALSDLLHRFRAALVAKLSLDHAPLIADDVYLARVLRTCKERLVQATDLANSFTFFFVEPDYESPEAVANKTKIWTANSERILNLAMDYFSGLKEEEFTNAVLNKFIMENTFQDVAAKKAKQQQQATNTENNNTNTNKFSFKELSNTIRFAVTAQTAGAGLTGTMETLGKPKVISRIQKVLELHQKMK